MANTLIIVEGPQDVEFIAGLLKPVGFRKVRELSSLDTKFGRRLLSIDFPHDGDLYARMPTPMYLNRDVHWVAIVSAGGANTHLASALRRSLVNLQPDPSVLSSVAIIRDADERVPADCFASLTDELETAKSVEGFEIIFPKAPGMITDGQPKMGIYIYPDNKSTGTLDDLLEECGATVYPDLLQGARVYVEGVDLEKLKRKDSQLIKKPSGPLKATVACVADILKPGMSIQASIDQNRWICDQTVSLPRIAALTSFLSDLVGEAV